MFTPLLVVLSPLLTQAAAPPPVEQDRLTVCLQQASSDPASAIVTANIWYGESQGAEQAFPQQCLGIAYTRLLRWEAAEQAFLAARKSALEVNPIQRAKLAAMAGNSALADKRPEAALADFAIALEDAAKANDTVLAGEIQIDRSRALVALDREGEAVEALATARRDAPQNSDGWLLSATLSRRMDDLFAAQSQIETAAGLDPLNPAIGLEAGVIAALGGRDEAARKSWQSVLDTAPDSAEAKAARTYLDQLGDAPS